MDAEFQNLFPDEGLIKLTDEPNKDLSPAQRVQLNRKGNAFLNGGDVESARRIFQTTGYSDGLIRVGEHYMKNRRPVDALKMFKLAHADGQVAEMAEVAAMAIRKLLKEEDEQ